jgi:hypothetical protein
MPPLDLINKLQRAQIKRDALAILEDPDLSVPIIYRRFVNSAYDPGQGITVTNWVDVAFRAYRGDIPLREIAYSNNLLSIGDQVLLFDGDELGGNLSTNDRILILASDSGEVVLLKDSPLVEGRDASFQSKGVQEGDFFKLDEFLIPVASIQSEKQLTLSSNWSSFDRPGTAYEIYKLHSVVFWQQDPLTHIIRVTVRRLA